MIRLLLVIFLTGCASQYYTKPFCVPRVKYEREGHKTEVGVRCHF